MSMLSFGRALSVSLILASCGAGLPPVYAGLPQPEAVRAVSQWNVGSDRLGIQGYDPVAYFPEGGGKAAKGSPSITHEHAGVTYRFVNEANRQAFRANPGRYEPAHGGWCSWAMREGDKVEVDPTSFLVQDGRLFLFYKGFLADTRSKWLKGDHAAEAKAADERWRALSGEPPRNGGAPAAAGALGTKLDQLQRDIQARVPADRLAVYERGIAEVTASGVAARALQEGARAPMFELPDARGRMTSLASMLEKGPVVLTWYRGGWCPYCNLQLRTYQEALAGRTDATLVAISPQTPDSSLTTAEKNALTFPVLSDRGNQVARMYGLAYTIPAESRFDLTPYNGENSAEMPMAATYVIDRSGTIVYAFVNADYRSRAEPAAILEALERAR